MALSKEQEEIYKKAMDEAKKELDNVDSNMQEEIQKARQKLAELQESKKHYRQIYEGTALLLGIEVEPEEESDLSQTEQPTEEKKAKEGEDEPCIFCSRIKQKYDKKNLILHRSQKAFIIMNRFPYNNGHLMVVPNRHIGDLMELSSGEKSELFSLLQLSTKALNRVMAPHGFNIGMNLGRVAGAGA